MRFTATDERVDIFTLYCISVCIICVSIMMYTIDRYSTFKKNTSQNQEQEPSQTLFDESLFSTVTVQAKAYIVYDIVDQKIIASKNEMEVLPLASITKIMTALSAVLHKNRSDKIMITSKSIEDGYDLGLTDKQIWKLSELLKYTLIFSSNDGAEVIADSFGGKEFFVSQMNTDAKNLGLTLIFTDPAGRDSNRDIGGLGNALEVAKLFAIARETIPEILDATTKKRESVATNSGKLRGIPNTNQTIEDLPGAEASKTGYTDIAGGNLGVIVDVSIGHPVVIVVLGSTKDGRFKDVDVLYKTLRSSMSPYPAKP